MCATCLGPVPRAIPRRRRDNMNRACDLQEGWGVGGKARNCSKIRVLHGKLRVIVKVLQTLSHLRKTKLKRHININNFVR